VQADARRSDEPARIPHRSWCGRREQSVGSEGTTRFVGQRDRTPDWLARHTEPILEPDLPIIDPHHHLWIRPGSRYLTDDLLADMNSGHNIVQRETDTSAPDHQAIRKAFSTAIDELRPTTIRRVSRLTS
jgi:hypothetical protein